MKKILMCEAMPGLTARHERNALKTHILPLNSPGQHRGSEKVQLVVFTHAACAPERVQILLNNLKGSKLQNLKWI